MAVDCSIYPGPEERPLPDQPGGGKVRIGAGGVPIVFIEPQDENSFSNCGNYGAALGANRLYYVPNFFNSNCNRVYLANGKCVELNSGGCSGTCVDTIDVEVEFPSCSAGPFTYTLSAGHMLPTGYRTSDVISVGVTGDYTCWWGKSFSPVPESETGDLNAELLDIVLAKNPVITESISGNVNNQVDKEGGWLLMLRSATNNFCDIDAKTVIYFEGPNTNNISGSYSYFGMGGLGNSILNTIKVNVLTDYEPPEKPCPRFKENIPNITSNWQAYRFNKCQISAWKLETLTPGTHNIIVSQFLDVGSTSFFLRFYGEDESFTNQDGQTIISNNGLATKPFTAESGKTYYFTVQNQDSSTSRYSYEMKYELIGSPGNFGQALGPILGSPLDTNTFCPCISANVITGQISLKPLGPGDFDSVIFGAKSKPSDFNQALGPVLGSPLDVEKTCICASTTQLITSNAIKPGPEGPAYDIFINTNRFPSDFVSAINPVLNTKIEILNEISCVCTSANENVFYQNLDLIPNKLIEKFYDLRPSPATNLTSLVFDVSGGIFNCQCNAEEDIYLTAETTPVSSTTYYISGGLTFDENIEVLRCIVLSDCPSALPGNFIYIEGGSALDDFNSDSYAENGWFEYSITSSGIISAASLNINGNVDSFPSEASFTITSPLGTVHTTQISDFTTSGPEPFNLSESTGIWNGEEMNGTWLIKKLDSFGDGGLGILDGSTVTFNEPGAIDSIKCSGTHDSGLGTAANSTIVKVDYVNGVSETIGNDGIYTYFKTPYVGDIQLYIINWSGNTNPGFAGTLIEYFGNDDTFSVLVDAASGFVGDTTILDVNSSGCSYWRIKELNDLTGDIIEARVYSI